MTRYLPIVAASLLLAPSDCNPFQTETPQDSPGLSEPAETKAMREKSETMAYDVPPCLSEVRDALRQDLGFDVSTMIWTVPGDSRYCFEYASCIEDPSLSSTMAECGDYAARVLRDPYSSRYDDYSNRDNKRSALYPTEGPGPHLQGGRTAENAPYLNRNIHSPQI